MSSNNIRPSKYPVGPDEEADLFDQAVAAGRAGKQDTLVSGTNIKTINGASVLGTGDLTVSSSASWGSITGTISAQTDLNTALSGKASTGAVTGTGITMSTARILGRSTSGTGAIEEITIGSGLTLTAGTLSASGGSSSLTVGTTPITSGTVGRILFEGTGNVLQQSANLFWNNTNSRLGIGTASPSATLHTVGSITASGAIARGNYMQPTLVAAANNDVMVGLDIAPTFTNGAFTGVTNLGLRVTGNTRLDGINSSAYAFSVYSSNTLRFGVVGFGGVEMPNGFNVVSSSTDLTTTRLRIGTSNATAPINIQAQSGNTDMIVLKASSGVDLFTIKHSTGNTLIGTSTDAGYKLDVNGTARVQGKLSVNTPTAASAVMEVTSTTQGFLPPRMTNAQMLAIAAPAAGLVVYDTTNNKHCGYNGTAWQNFY